MSSQKRSTETFLQIVKNLTAGEVRRLFFQIVGKNHAKVCTKRYAMAVIWADAVNHQGIERPYYPALRRTTPKRLNVLVTDIIAKRAPVMAFIYRDGVVTKDTVPVTQGMKTIQGVIVELQPPYWTTHRGGPYSTAKDEFPVVMEREIQAVLA